MTAAKLVAARELGVPVVLLDRPPTPDAPAVVSVEEAVVWLENRLGRTACLDGLSRQ
jgi:precorrin-6A/cobalt-precorrin-6A reductase